MEVMKVNKTLSKDIEFWTEASEFFKDHNIEPARGWSELMDYGLAEIKRHYNARKAKPEPTESKNELLEKIAEMERKLKR